MPDKVHQMVDVQRVTGHTVVFLEFCHKLEHATHKERRERNSTGVTTLQLSLTSNQNSYLYVYYSLATATG